MKDRRLKRILTSAAAVLLAFCMSAGSFTTRVFAEEEEKTVFETQDGGENGKQSGEGMSNGLEEPASEELSSEGPGTENPGTDEPGGEEPGTEKPDTEKSGAEEPGDSGKKTETDDTSDNSTGGDENETEEIPVEEPFEETGIFGCYTVNSYGRVINSWYDSSRNAYYLFLTNTGTPESFILYCTGVKPAAVSAGELDEATHVITGAFSATGSEVEVTGSNGQKYTVIAMQSELPSLYISLNGTTLSHINSNGKDEKYNGNSLILTDESGSINLEQDGTVQIKGRGNTTWDSAAKKGYQLKFDKKQKVLGMAKAKKWVLLANSFDDSMARNMTAFHAASSLDMEYVTEYRYVDLWVDGDYQGTYILGEKSEINENRLNLTDPTGVLMELDNFFYGQEDYWFLDAYLNYKFAVKECVDEDNPNSVLSGMDQFRDKLDRFWNYITNTDTSVITLESLGAYIDVESFARWYLVNEFASNVEAASTSCFISGFSGRFSDYSIFPPSGTRG
ncbi:MAG: CotH kinase family protein [Eubacterium sp.]|nr:CotH kinase family protein [Eubacterium sp.]